MKTLFLQAPSFDGFDGGAGSRYQAKREIKSFWYPTWLAQPAALVENSKLVDAPAHNQSLADILPMAKDHDLVKAYTSVPSFQSDIKTVAALKEMNPNLKAGLIGAKVAVDADGSLRKAPQIDFVARNEFDFTIKDVADGLDWSKIAGLSYRNSEGVIVHNDDRAILEDMDSLPFVTPIYKRDLKIENYFIGYLKHPYISIYTGRGCKSRCTFCLWPQTVGGHRYRTRSVANVLEEIAWAKKAFPQVKEFFFDDDTFTDNLTRAEEIAKGLGKLGVTWSCNAKANVPRESLKVMSENGLRLLLVGYESGNQRDPAQHQKRHARRSRREVHEGLPRCGRGNPRHVHPRGLLRRDAGDDRRDDPLRQPHQSAHHSGSAGGALPRHVPSTSRPWKTAGSTRTMRSSWTSTASRSRRCTTRI